MDRLIEQLRKEPQIFLQAFAAPARDGRAFTIKGLEEAVLKLGYTQEQLFNCAWAAVGFRPGFPPQKEDGKASTDAAVSPVPIDALSPSPDQRVSLKAPPGLYRITKFGKKTAADNELGFIELHSHKLGWNHRKFICSDEASEAVIAYVNGKAPADAKLVWRLRTTLKNGASYDLGFWLDFGDRKALFRFSGTYAEATDGKPAVLLEGILDDELYSGFGGFFGRMLQQVTETGSQQGGNGGDSGGGNNGGAGQGANIWDYLESPLVVVIRGLLGFFFFYLALRALRRNWVRAHAVVPLPADMVLQQSPDDVDWDNMLEEDMEKRQERMEELKKKIQVIETCKINIFPFGDDKKDPDDPSKPGQPPLGQHGSHGVQTNAAGDAILEITLQSSKGVQEASECLLDVLQRPLREKMTELLMNTFTTINEVEQVVEAAKDSSIDWPNIACTAIKKTAPKKGDPERTMAEVQRSYLDTVKQYVAPTIVASTTSVYASMMAQPGVAKLIELIAWPDFSNYLFDDAITKTIASDKVFEGIASESIRATLVQARGLGPSTSTTPGSGLESFRLQLDGLRVAEAMRTDYLHRYDVIAKLAASGELSLQNADKVLREKVDLVAVKPGMYAPAATPNEWDETANVLANMGMMIGLAGAIQGKTGVNPAKATNTNFMLTADGIKFPLSKALLRL